MYIYVFFACHYSVLCGMLIKNEMDDHIGSKSYIVELRCCGDSANCINKLQCKVGHRISNFHVRQISIIQQIRVIEPNKLHWARAG